MHYRLTSIAVVALGMAGCATATQQGTGPVMPSTGFTPILSRSNPFYAASTLQYQAPAFDHIKDSDYEPAMVAGMQVQIGEIDAITNQAAAPTFDNTIVAMERSGVLLTRAAKVFNAVTGANTNDTLQAIQERISPKLAEHNDKIYLNAKLYQRVKAIYDGRASAGLTTEQKYLAELYYKNFIRAGAQLSDADQTRLRALNQEEAKLTTDFGNHLLAATKKGALVLDNVSDLDGFTPGEIETAATAAKQRGLNGKWVIPLQNTTQHPAQAELKNRAVRQRLFIASTTRAEQGDANDTRDIIKRLAQLRGERAKLLGFPNGVHRFCLLLLLCCPCEGSRYSSFSHFCSHERSASGSSIT